MVVLSQQMVLNAESWKSRDVTEMMYTQLIMGIDNEQTISMSIFFIWVDVGLLYSAFLTTRHYIWINIKSKAPNSISNNHTGKTIIYRLLYQSAIVDTKKYLETYYE